MLRHVLFGLLVSLAPVVYGTDASATPRAQHMPAHRSKKAAAEHHKYDLSQAGRSAIHRKGEHQTTSATAPSVPLLTTQHMSGHRAEAAAVQHHKHGPPLADRSAARRKSEHYAANTKAPTVLLPRERPAAASLPPDLALVKQTIELVRQGKWDEATAFTPSGDPVANKLVEWVLLRDANSQAAFERYAAFMRDNPNWPSLPLLRRRAEARLWQDRRDAATVRRFLSGEPTSALGRLALARTLKSEGDRAGAAAEVRAVWRLAEMSAELEAAVLNTFRDELTRADDVVRMDWRLSAKDFGAAMRAAKRLSDNEVAIIKACAAAEANTPKAGALLDAVPAATRGDIGFILCRVHWLLGHDPAAAAKLVLAASPDDLQRQDTDEWWRERRLLARELIDLGDPEMAYRVVRAAVIPRNPYYRAEFHFMAGWIALRFLNDSSTALEHFAKVDEGSTDPIVRARAAYWRGRAAEANGQPEEMRVQYQAAARYPTAYYGQLARARLDIREIVPVRPPPRSSLDGMPELLRAAQMLYAIGERELTLSFVSDLAKESTDVTTLAALGQLAAQNNDAQAMLVIGKTALARGLPMEEYAFPDIGVPSYTPITGSEIDASIVYSVVRTESGFDPHDISPAKAVGLMQVTPEAGRDTAERYHVAYDWNRLLTSSAYNMQMGVGELAALLKEYRGSFILTFAGYNAGRSRVKQWIAQHGDPRDPGVDAVDWVERIPLSETRNYVQRVMENLQVYATHFSSTVATVEPNLHRPMRLESNADPTK